jgi:hypothetical protein
MSHSHDAVWPWIALGVYVAGFAVTARVYYAMLDDGSDESRRRAQSGCIGIIWPLVAAAAVLWLLVTLPTRGVKIKHDRQIARETAEWEHEKRATRIAGRNAELEAENERLRRQMEGKD